MNFFVKTSYQKIFRSRYRSLKSTSSYFFQKLFCIRLHLQLHVKHFLNHQPGELCIYSYSLKRARKKTKDLEENIYFRLGLSTDTAEQNTAERVQHFPSNPRIKKRVSERVLPRVVHIIRSETLGRRLARAKSLAKSLAESLTNNLAEILSPKLSVRVVARRLARLFALAKRLPRVSDRIICMALRKTLSKTRFFTRAEVVDHLCLWGLLPLQGQHMGTNLFSQRAIITTNTRVSGFLKNSSTIYFWAAPYSVPNH